MNPIRTILRGLRTGFRTKRIEPYVPPYDAQTGRIRGLPVAVPYPPVHERPAPTPAPPPKKLPSVAFYEAMSEKERRINERLRSLAGHGVSATRLAAAMSYMNEPKNGIPSLVEEPDWVMT